MKTMMTSNHNATLSTENLRTALALSEELERRQRELENLLRGGKRGVGRPAGSVNVTHGTSAGKHDGRSNPRRGKVKTAILNILKHSVAQKGMHVGDIAERASKALGKPIDSQRISLFMTLTGVPSGYVEHVSRGFYKYVEPAQQPADKSE